MPNILSRIVSRFRTSPEPAPAAGNIYNVSANRYQPRASIDLHFVRAAINNAYLREQVINLMPQVFAGAPEISVHPIGEIDPNPDLTDEYTQLFRQLHAYTSMQVTYQDTLYFGASIKSIGYADEGGEAVISEIRDLPAATFGSSYTRAGALSTTPNPLMPGISVSSDGAITVAQTDPVTLRQTPLTNYRIITQPGTPQPAGEAYCMPIYPVIAEIDVVTRALQQKIRRIGQPLVLPRVSPDFVGDIAQLNEWARGFLQRWGTRSGEMLPAGIELADVKIYESQGGEERLKTLTDLIAKFFNPTTTLDKDGQHILSTTDTGRTAIWHAYITSQQEWIEEEYERIFGEMLWINGYDDYEITITIPRPGVDKSDIKIQQLNIGLQHHLITRSEAREALDTLDLPPMSPEIEEELDTTAASHQQQPLPQINNPHQQQLIDVTNVRNSIDAFADAVVQDAEIPPDARVSPTAQLQADSHALEVGMQEISDQVRDALAEILRRGA